MLLVEFYTLSNDTLLLFCTLRTTNLGQQAQGATGQQTQRNPPSGGGTQTGTNTGVNTPNTPGSQSASTSPMKKHVLDNLAKLMCACVIMKVEEFSLYRVTTSGNKQMPKEFITGKLSSAGRFFLLQKLWEMFFAKNELTLSFIFICTL